MRSYKNIYKGKQNLKKLMFEYFNKNINKTSIINSDTGFEIKFDYEGGKKSTYGSQRKATETVDSRLTSKKAIIIHHLPQILKEAKYVNNAEPQGGKKQHKNVVMFLYFHNTVKIDGVISKFRFVVRLFKNDKGRFHYSLEEILK